MEQRSQQDALPDQPAGVHSDPASTPSCPAHDGSAHTPANGTDLEALRSALRRASAEEREHRPRALWRYLEAALVGALHLDPAVLLQIQDFFSRRGRPMPGRCRLEAMVPGKLSEAPAATPAAAAAAFFRNMRRVSSSAIV